MDSISLKQFRDRLPDYLDQVVNHHNPLKVKGQKGSDFIVVSAEDWEQMQETLYVLQNSSLMQQIHQSFKTHLNHLAA